MRMQETYVRSTEYMPEKVISKYFQVYSPSWNFSSPEDRTDFLKLYFKISQEYYRRFLKRAESIEFIDEIPDLEATFIEEYADNLLLMKGQSFNLIVKKLINDYESFLVEDHLQDIHQGILEQCRIYPHSDYSKQQICLIESQRGNHDLALSIANELLEKDPNSIHLLSMVGSVKEAMHDYSSALAQYRKAYTISLRTKQDKFNGEHFKIEAVISHDKDFLLFKIMCCNIKLNKIPDALESAILLRRMLHKAKNKLVLPDIGFGSEAILEELDLDISTDNIKRNKEFNELYNILRMFKELYAKPLILE